MSIITTIEGIEARISALTSQRAKYDPGAGLNVTVNNPGSDTYLELQIADGEEVFELLRQSLANSHERMLSLARIEHKRLSEFLNKYGKAV